MGEESHTEETIPESSNTPNMQTSNTASTSFVAKYWENSRNSLFNYVLVLPLLLIYELLIYISQPASGASVRISADVWIKSLYYHLGYNTVSITLLIAALFGIFLFINQRQRGIRLRAKHLLLMLVEAVGWALLLGWSIGLLTGAIVDLQTVVGNAQVKLTTLQEVALSLGAGLYEELFFRLILIWLGFKIFKHFFDYPWMAYFAAALVSAFLFSIAHFTGSMGEAFTLNAFIFRFLFGLAFNALFITRGFAITAWTHAWYDLIVIFWL